MRNTGVRGCGLRHKGAVYLEIGMASEGWPVDAFLIDPPLRVPPGRYSPIGVHALVRGQVTHVVDWVGSEHYPNVADFVEEARRMGVSRRIPRTFDFSRLTRDSRLILIHARAFVANWREVIEPSLFGCPRGLHTPGSDVPCCAGAWWFDVGGGEPVLDPAVPYRTIVRGIGSITYRAYRPPDGHRVRYHPAMFASFPISNIAVIRDPDGDSHLEAFDRATRASLPVSLEES